MTHIPVSGHKQSIAHEKTVAREKKFTTAFSSYGNVTFLSARYIRERKYSSVGIRTLTLTLENIFRVESDCTRVSKLVPNPVFSISEKKRFQEKVVKIYFDVN